MGAIGFMLFHVAEKASMITGPVTNRERVEGSLDHPQFPMLESRTVEKASTGARWDRGCAVALRARSNSVEKSRIKGRYLGSPSNPPSVAASPIRMTGTIICTICCAGEEHDLGHDVGASDNSGSEHLAGICQERHHG